MDDLNLLRVVIDFIVYLNFLKVKFNLGYTCFGCQEIWVYFGRLKFTVCHFLSVDHQHQQNIGYIQNIKF